MNDERARRARGLRLAAALLACAVAAGCANAPRPLYGWGSYQRQVYEHFKGGQGAGPQAQISALEGDLQRMRAKGEAPPPGYHAHLGLLYASLGQDEASVRELLTEKERFPESGPYIDFLLSKNKKGGQ